MKILQFGYFVGASIAVLLGLFPISAQSGGQAGNLDDFLGKATSTQTLPMEGLFSCQTINDKFIGVFGEGADRELRVYTGDAEKVLWSVKFPFTFYNLSRGDHPAIVLVQILDEIDLNFRAYSIDGEFLFAKDTFPQGVILASPNGNYFYTGFSPEETNDLIIFDKKGNELLNFPGDSTHWVGAYAFNDSIIALFAKEDIIFLAIPSGQRLKSVSVPVGPNKEDKFPIGASAKVARNGDHMIVYWHHRIVYITPQLDIGWELESKPFFLNSAFSDDCRYVAIYQYPPRELSMYMLSSGKLLWTQPVESESYVGTSGISDLIIAGDIIRILDPQTEYLMQGKINESTKSLLFRYKPADGDFSDSLILGRVVFFSKYENINKFISIGSDNKMLMIKDWKYEK